MGRVFKVVILFTVLLLLFTSQSKAIGKEDSWKSRLNERIVNDPSMKGTSIGISIRSANDGKILYDRSGDIRLRPASNLKLLTAASALAILGEDYSFSTEIRTNSKIKNNILKGDLYFKGKGDPTLRLNDIKKMARELQRKGIREIQGDLVADDNWYDHLRYSMDLPWSDEQTYYGAPISALTVSPTKDYDAATVLLNIKPAKTNGEKAEIKLTPPIQPLKVLNETKTSSAGEKTTITVQRAHSADVVTIRGTIGLNAKPIKEWIAIRNPSKYAAQLLKASLEDEGVHIKGRLKEGETPEAAKLLLVHHSIPLSQLLVPFMKLSNNGHAEVLVKEMGKVKYGEGSWEKGLVAINSQLPMFGIDPGQIVMRDGSGVSHVNLVTANQLSRLLFSVQKEPWFKEFYQSLPQAGAKEKLEGGTLRNRLTDSSLKGKIRAKTGTISTVSSLSGYIHTKSGQTLIFSILLNNLLGESEGKKIEDDLVRILAELQ